MDLDAGNATWTAQSEHVNRILKEMQAHYRPLASGAGSQAGQVWVALYGRGAVRRYTARGVLDEQTPGARRRYDRHPAGEMPPSGPCD